MQHLYIASASCPRHDILTQSGISFTQIEHHAQEKQCSWTGTVYDVALRVAHKKMEHVAYDMCDPHNVAYILTADTVSIDHQGTIHGKPQNYQDAVDKIKQLRAGSTVCTGVCIRHFVYDDNAWRMQDETSLVVSAYVVFDVPDDWIDTYLKHQPHALSASGAIAIEGYGAQFLKRISGSYTAVLGLPIYQVRQALADMGFYQ